MCLEDAILFEAERLLNKAKNMHFVYGQLEGNRFKTSSNIEIYGFSYLNLWTTIGQTVSKIVSTVSCFFEHPKNY